MSDTKAKCFAKGCRKNAVGMFTLTHKDITITLDFCAKHLQIERIAK